MQLSTTAANKREDPVLPEGMAGHQGSLPREDGA